MTDAYLPLVRRSEARILEMPEQRLDFDIYKPNQRQVKRLSPPRKICFAIKSQQKSTMFLNGANFAASVGPLTGTWYSALRTWRSWYLVNVLGKGQEQKSNQSLSKEGSPKASDNAARGEWTESTAISRARTVIQA